MTNLTDPTPTGHTDIRPDTPTSRPTEQSGTSNQWVSNQPTKGVGLTILTSLSQNNALQGLIWQA